MADLETSLKQILNVWSQWSLGRKMFVVLGSIVGIGGFVAIVSVGGRLDYSPLMTGLDPDDAVQVAESLDSLRVPYKISHGGSSIMVPSDRVPELRMKLAGEGLPRGGAVGFEIFDEANFGMSRFAEQLNYRRALEGELRRTIKSIGVIKDARVHLVMPKRQLFRERKVNATASVTVTLRKGRRLSEGQVAGIVHLVSSSVEGVASDDVTIVDSSGKVLARGGGGMMALSKGLDHQRRIEQDLEQRVVGILERVIGPGRVSAQVAAELDFTQSEKTTESYDPEGAVVRSEQINDESRVAGGTTAGGIPGARSNNAGALEETAEMGQGNEDTKRTKITNYEISKNIRKELNEVAQVKRISVAVLVDGNRALDAEGQQTYTERAPEELTRLTELVKSSVGFDEARGDKVVLDSMSFSAEAETLDDAEGSMGVWDYIGLLWRPISALLFLVLLLGVMRATKRLADGPTEILDSPKSVRELEAALGGSGVPSLPHMQSDSGKVRPEPDKAAAVIKGWLAEG